MDWIDLKNVNSPTIKITTECIELDVILCALHYYDDVAAFNITASVAISIASGGPRA